MTEIVYPQGTGRVVRALRFLNVLDDQENKVSPVKVNVWAANAAVLGTAVGTALAWLGGHMGFVEQVYAPVMTWLTHAHTVHHFDKRERSAAVARETTAARGTATP